MSIENITIDVTWFECSVSFPRKIYSKKRKKRKKENIAKNTRKKSNRCEIAFENRQLETVSYRECWNKGENDDSEILFSFVNDAN